MSGGHDRVLQTSAIPSKTVTILFSRLETLSHVTYAQSSTADPRAATPTKPKDDVELIVLAAEVEFELLVFGFLRFSSCTSTGIDKSWKLLAGAANASGAGFASRATTSSKGTATGLALAKVKRRSSDVYRMDLMLSLSAWMCDVFPLIFKKEKR